MTKNLTYTPIYPGPGERTGRAITNPDGKPFGQIIDVPGGWDYDRHRDDKVEYRGFYPLFPDAQRAAETDYAWDNDLPLPDRSEK